MVNLSQIFKYTPSKIKKRTVKTVKSIRVVKAIHDIDEFGKNQKVMFKVIATTIPRRVTIKLYGDINKPHMQRKAWVHCNCEWFTYFCEYSLAKRRSSSIINSNGNAPVEKNPRQWPYVCKHIIATFKRLPKVNFKMPKVKPNKEELEFFMKEIEKYIPGS